jgi:carbon monoxide dehydrogenase subunit G
MPRARRAHIVAATPECVWELIADPRQMPRWWPGVTRVEGVHEGHFTQVFKTERGRSVRVDLRLRESRSPWLRAWEQELDGTPLARVLSEVVTEIRLEPAPAGTRVTIEQRQKLRGHSRTGGFMFRRATSKKLAQALAGLERACS